MNCLFLFSFKGLFEHKGYQPVVCHMCCIYFSQSVIYLFTLFMAYFSIIILKFYVINIPIIPIFSFIMSVFPILLKKSSPNPEVI